MRTRDYRRHQRLRAIERHMTWLDHSPFYRDEDRDERRARALRWFKHPAMCSSYCCGNPRKWFGEATIQERRASFWCDEE